MEDAEGVGREYLVGMLVEAQRRALRSIDAAAGGEEQHQEQEEPYDLSGLNSLHVAELVSELGCHNLPPELSRRVTELMEVASCSGGADDTNVESVQLAAAEEYLGGEEDTEKMCDEDTTKLLAAVSEWLSRQPHDAARYKSGFAKEEAEREQANGIVLRLVENRIAAKG